MTEGNNACDERVETLSEVMVELLRYKRSRDAWGVDHAGIDDAIEVVKRKLIAAGAPNVCSRCGSTKEGSEGSGTHMCIPALGFACDGWEDEDERFRLDRDDDENDYGPGPSLPLGDLFDDKKKQ